jgi:hypothetical protein
VGGKGENEKINKKGGKGKEKRGGGIMAQLWGVGPPRSNPSPPNPNYVNLYLLMVPKYPMNKIHPWKMVGD